MDSQDHKTAATSTGHEGHGVHLCHRCGWPFPNPHPSARHRRAHKRVCGTIEGYKIENPEEHDRHLADSDDEHDSDEDDHTPSPNLDKKNAEDSGRVGAKSNKSEDDSYSDAVMHFSDSGISPSLEERFESVKEVDTSREPKVVEGDQTSDKTEQSNDPKKSDKITIPGPPLNETNLAVGIIPTSDTSGEAVSGQGQTKPGEDADIQGQDGNLASVTAEGKILDRTLTAVGQECEVVKHDLPRPNETVLNSDTSEEANNGARSADRSTSDETVKISLEETHGKEDDSVGLKEVSQSTEEIRPVKVDDSVELKEVSQSTEEIRPVKEDDSLGLKEVSQSTEEIKPEKEDCSVELKEVSHSTEEIRPVGTVGEDTSPNVALMVSSIDQEIKPKTSLDENVSASERETCDINGKEKRNLESKESFYFDTVPTFESTDSTLAPGDDQAFKKDVDHCEEKYHNKHLESGNEKSEGTSVEERVIPDPILVSDKATDFLTDARNSEELSKNASLEVPFSSEISEIPNNINVTENVDRVERVDVVENVCESKDNNKVDASEKASEPSIPKESTSLSADPKMIENSANESAELKRKVNLTSSTEISDSKCPDETSVVVEESRSSKDSSAELDGNFLVSEIHLVTLSSKEAVPPPSDHDKKAVINVEDVDLKPWKAEVDEKLTKENEGVSVINLSGSSSDRADSMDATYGSVVSDTLETNSQKPKTAAEEARLDKSDTFEPPSFMTLVQSEGEGDRAKAATEIETVQKNQQPKSDSLQAGWFPSLTNVVNESEGRKKNKEIIAKVTNWSPVKQHHSPLKSLLSEVKSPETKQVESETKDSKGGTKDSKGGGTTVGPAVKDQDVNSKDVEEWNSPARYPIEMKKEKKKKGRSYWVPFVCCSAVHRDL